MASEDLNGYENKWSETKARGALFFYLAFIALIPICILLNLWLGSNFSKKQQVRELTNYQPIPTDRILENAGVDLPLSARDVYEYSYGLNAVYSQVRFTIDAEDLDELLESSICAEPLVEISPDEYENGLNNTDWWLPEEATILMKCNGRTEIYSQTILVDMSSREQFIIYVVGSTNN